MGSEASQPLPTRRPIAGPSPSPTSGPKALLPRVPKTIWVSSSCPKASSCPLRL